MTYKIILLRHGESEGNVDHTVYERVFDHDIELTTKGINQSIDAGKTIHKIIKEAPLDVFVSPYMRTRQTWEGVRKGLARNNINVDLDPRLREQEHKIFKNSAERSRIFKERDKMGKFWYRFGNAEAGVDVYSRINTFLSELRMDRKIFEHENDCLIVAHEIALRAIIMKLFRLDVNDFDNLPEIENCSPIILETLDFKTASLVENGTVNNEELIKFLKPFNK